MPTAATLRQHRQRRLHAVDVIACQVGARLLSLSKRKRKNNQQTLHTGLRARLQNSQQVMDGDDPLDSAQGTYPISEMHTFV